MIIFFFFSSRRRHTRFKCDWSSDVCSSDLDRAPRGTRIVVAIRVICGLNRSMKRLPVGIGIIGTGFARTTQIPGFRDCMGAKIVAISSRIRERGEAIAKEFGIDHVVTDWMDLVTHPDVNLVSIVTPPSTHLEITLAALDHGKAVLCEKPMALNADEARRMVEKANAAGVLALIDHELRFLNSRRVMRGMLQAGAIGTVRHCNYVFRSDYRGIADRAWDWWSDETMGGGAL